MMTSQEVLLALFVGIFSAATIVAKGNVLTGFLATMSSYMVESLANADHAFVILFSWFLAGLVAVVQKSGGGHGIANAIMEKITSRRGLMMSVYFLGFVIFFDDYANTLILGSTMRPLSDAFFVSREKLAFIVDATTAPIASIAPISSWIGYEVGLINDQLGSLISMGYGAELEEAGLTSGYTIFLESIASRYYPIFMLMFQFMLIALKRDMGPMLKAERRAMDKKQVSDPSANDAEVELDTSLEPAENTPKLWWNSAVPILVTLILVFVSLVVTGYQSTVADGDPINAANIFGNGNAYASLLYGAFIGSVFAWIMIRVQYHYKGKPYNAWKHFIKFEKLPVDEDGDCPRPILTFKESLATWIEGIKGLTTPVLVLIMAWGIGAAVQDVSCDLFFASGLSSDSIDPRILPTLTFLISAVISFCTYRHILGNHVDHVPTRRTCCVDQLQGQGHLRHDHCRCSGRKRLWRPRHGHQRHNHSVVSCHQVRPAPPCRHSAALRMHCRAVLCAPRHHSRSVLVPLLGRHAHRPRRHGDSSVPHCGACRPPIPTHGPFRAPRGVHQGVMAEARAFRGFHPRGSRDGGQRIQGHLDDIWCRSSQGPSQAGSCLHGSLRTRVNNGAAYSSTAH